MPTWRVNNSTVLGGEVCSPWQASHVYALGARCVCTIAYATTAARAVVFECTTGGTSGAAQPTWDYVVGNTTADGTVVWTARAPSDGNWNNASCYLHYVLNHGAPAAGDIVYIDDGHNESYAASLYVTGIVSTTAPLRIYCVDKATDALSTGAIVGAASGNNLYFTQSGYSYGVNYRCIGAGSIICRDDTNGIAWILEGFGSTELLRVTNSGNYLLIGGTAKSQSLKIVAGSINFITTGNFIYLYANSVLFEWTGGSLIASAGVTKLFDGASSTRNVRIKNVDLSAVGSANALVDVGDSVNHEVLFERCKFPASFTPVVGTWPVLRMGKVRCHHCSDANKTYDFREDSPEGTVQDETTIVMTGGASDGTTPQSWKLQSNSIPDQNNGFALESPPMAGWTTSTTSKTFTIECIADSATNLQNDEVWMELEYPANATDGLGAIAKDKCVQLGTPADKTASSVTWTTTGMTNPNKFKCQVTVTPGKVGPITARVYVAKVSTTIYVNPKITES